jgi:multidrug efflux pump
VMGLLPELRVSISPAIDITPAVDRSTTIRASLAEVERTLIISVILVVLVVFFFLRSGRATLVPAVAVPVSLIGTFGVMYLLGYSIDNLSMMALTVATGFVVTTRSWSSRTFHGTSKRACRASEPRFRGPPKLVSRCCR